MNAGRSIGLLAGDYEFSPQIKGPHGWPVGVHQRSVAAHPMRGSVRLTSFALAVLLLAGLVGWAARTTWHDMQQLRRSYAAVEGDAFHLSEYVEASIRDMHETILRFESRKDPSDRARFLSKGKELKQWIGAHIAPLTTPSEGELMKQIQAAFEVYLSRSITLMDERAKAGTASSANAVLEMAENNAAPILELCQQLTAAERVALAQFLKDSHQSLGWLQRLLLALFALLLGLGGVVGFSVYRELLAPLRNQLRQSRAVLQRHEKLASLGTLAAGLAHEIRNPLTAINVRIHSLKRSLTQGSSEHEDATVIDSEIHRLEGIVREFLQFARPAEPKFVTVSADRLLVKVQRLLGGQLEKNFIQLSLESPPDVWIRADPQQVEQALINLVQNAAESIRREGKICLSARADTARLAGRTCPVVVLEVRDTGMGIPPEVQKRLFDPFFTTKEEGTGLGLSIAARIVEQHGGTLHYKTELNRGTTFAIVLPFAEHHPDEPTTQDSPH
jgi:signal transduction histidine kinase